MATMLNPNAIPDGSITQEKIDASVLEAKQDVIDDLETIRSNANKGSTALQSYTESDPVYIADKPKIALKSEIPDISGLATKEEVAAKQDTLTPGNGISIEDNKIGVTAITESENQPSTHLWVNPSEDAETNVTYNRSQIDALVEAKQDTLQLTVKDNGNIVLSNIQGQSKEFMPATPSGDPMHYAYVAAGAEYNDTGADIVKTTPWADLADDDADKTVVHKAGYWYLNGLGDITSEDIRNIYATSANVLQFDDIREVFSFEYNCRTYFPGKVNFLKGGYVPSNIGAAFVSSHAVSIDILNRQVNSVYKFITSSTTQYILSRITINKGTTISDAFKNSYLKYVKINQLNSSIIFNSPYLYTKCILYMIEKEAATSAITITIHPDAYARAMANADIVAALEAHPNVSLASA